MPPPAMMMGRLAMRVTGASVANGVSAVTRLAFHVMWFGRLSFTRTAHGKPRMTESNGLLSCRCSESKTTAEGERGAVYITTLYRWGAPQIRFNINDISRIIPGLCPCGGTLKRLDRIFGRNDTMVKLRGVNVFPEAVGAVVVADRRTNGEYVCIVERVGADEREEMTVLIEVPDATLDRDELQCDFERRFKEVLGVRVIVQAVDRGGTDRYTGTSQSSKIKRLLDRRQGARLAAPAISPGQARTRTPWFAPLLRSRRSNRLVQKEGLSV